MYKNIPMVYKVAWWTKKPQNIIQSPRARKLHREFSVITSLKSKAAS